MNIYEEFPKMLEGNDAYMHRFNREHYADAFASYMSEHTPLFDEIENACRAEADPASVTDRLAKAFTDAAKASYDAQKKGKRTGYLIDMNTLLVVYVLPSLREYSGTFGEPLVNALTDTWNATFTQYKIKPGTFAEINSGFRRKLCYVTTAVCESLGKDENCHEIRMLKEYRDGFLTREPDGRELIDKYYDIAPTIVNRINKRPDASDAYAQIYRTYISPCISMIEENRLHECKAHYVEMMQVLCKQYMYR